MKRFDLFGYLGQSGDEEATTYQCGYYVINKYTNQISDLPIRDKFYTFLDNYLLKFEMIQDVGIQYFNVYLLKEFTSDDWWKIDCLIRDYEDIDEEMIHALLEIDNYDPFKDAEINEFLKEIEGNVNSLE